MRPHASKSLGLKSAKMRDESSFGNLLSGSIDVAASNSLSFLLCAIRLPERVGEVERGVPGTVMGV